MKRTLLTLVSLGLAWAICGCGSSTPSSSDAETHATVTGPVGPKGVAGTKPGTAAPGGDAAPGGASTQTAPMPTPPPK